MIRDREQAIRTLTRSLLPAVPWHLKWSGWVNNRWNESAVERILATRSHSDSVAAWRLMLPNTDSVERVLTAIGSEMGWKKPRFIPQDECFVVMKMWWHGFSDCWERERCMWAIEQILEARPPLSIVPMISDMTLGDLLSHFNRGDK